MDTCWDYRDWAPTDAMWNIEPDRRPAKRYIEQAKTNLIEAATFVKELPYWHHGWLRRSAELLNLGYPDLAIADAYKGMLLCKAGVDYCDSLGEKVRLAVGLHLIIDEELGVSFSRTRLRRVVKQWLTLNLRRAYSLQMQALVKLDATPDIISIGLEATKMFPDDVLLRRHLEEARDVFQQKVTLLDNQGLSFHDFKRRLIFGGWSPNLYPWMPAEYHVRNEAMIAAANQDLKSCSENIEIRLSPNQGIEDCYGAFATRKIRAGEKVLGGMFPFAVSPEQGTTQCYNCFKCMASIKTVVRFECCPSIGYCSSDCQSNAKKHYHSAICSKDFSSILNRAQRLYGGNFEGSQCQKKGVTELGQITGWSDKPSKGYPMVGRPLPDQTPCVMIRILAMCVKNSDHPLRYPLVAQLVQGPPMVIERFSMNGMVIAPIKTLQVLDVDIFADDRYDTWVLRTIWMRIANNVAGSESKGFPNWVLGPFCWLNHSCDPNAGPGARWGDGINEDQVALRDIEKGEEVCVKYIDVSGDRKTRAAMLMAWFGEECKCARCSRES